MPDSKDKKFGVTATTLYGLEGILAGELEKAGAEEITKKNRAVSFRGNKKLLYRANLSLRTASRLLVPIQKFGVRDEKKLYEAARDIDWKKYLGVKDTFAVDSVVHSPHFNHSKYVALKIKDAIVDQFRDRYGRRPSVDRERPDLRINVHIDRSVCVISLDSSGFPLHRRGYRLEGSTAPINEVLAAGMVMLSGYDGSGSFIDPLCGSGTIVIEAAMIALDIAPGLLRKDFGFFRWKDYDSKLYKRIVRELSADTGEGPAHQIVGSDISGKTIRVATKNVERAGLQEAVRLHTGSIEKLVPPPGPGIMVTNPPYGERMGKEDINGFYKSIGDALKSEYNGYDAWIISSNREAMKHIGLRPSRKVPLYNGPSECRFQKYSIYSGSKKARYNKERERD